MKARIDRSNLSKSPVDLVQNTQQNKEFQFKLQMLEENFAKKHGIIPRTIVYGPSNRSLNREIMIDQMVNKNYLCYQAGEREFNGVVLPNDISKEQFKIEFLKIIGKDADINKLLDLSLDNIDKGRVEGLFNRTRPDNLYLFSNGIKGNEILARNVLKHETFHAGIYDLEKGVIPQLLYYKSNRTNNEDFLQCVIAEREMRTLIENRNSINGFSEVFSLYSFEEEFVRYNTLCSMLEDELKQNKYDLSNVIQIVNRYVIESGMMVKSKLKDKTVDLYGKKVSLDTYLPQYFDILRGSKNNYDKIDKDLSPAIANFINIEGFKEIKSSIPMLVDQLLERILKGNCFSFDIKSIIDIYNGKLNMSPID